MQTAGQADIAHDPETGFLGITIGNHSGHYIPSFESLKIAIEKFKAAGIEFREIEEATDE